MLSDQACLMSPRSWASSIATCNRLFHGFSTGTVWIPATLSGPSARRDRPDAVRTAAPVSARKLRRVNRVMSFC